MKSFLRAFTRTFDYKGRSSRSEYLAFLIVFLLVGFGLMEIEAWSGLAYRFPLQIQLPGLLTQGWLLFCMPTLLTLILRRLHDANLSSWYALACFIPHARYLFILSLLFIPGTDGPNDYGQRPDPNPKD